MGLFFKKKKKKKKQVAFYGLDPCIVLLHSKVGTKLFDRELPTNSCRSDFHHEISMSWE